MAELFSHSPVSFGILASLERVKKLEEQLFKEHEEKIKLNVKASKNGGFSSGKSIAQKENEVEKQKQDQKEREYAVCI